MKSAIDEFYEFESSFVDWIDRGERYEEMKKEMGKLFSQLSLCLTEEQRLILGNIRLLHGRLESEAEKATYKAGFKRGLNLAMESFPR